MPTYAFLPCFYQHSLNKRFVLRAGAKGAAPPQSAFLLPTHTINKLASLKTAAFVHNFKNSVFC